MPHGYVDQRSRGILCTGRGDEPFPDPVHRHWRVASTGGADRGCPARGRRDPGRRRPGRPRSGAGALSPVPDKKSDAGNGRVQTARCPSAGEALRRNTARGAEALLDPRRRAVRGRRTRCDSPACCGMLRGRQCVAARRAAARLGSRISQCRADRATRHRACPLLPRGQLAPEPHDRISVRRPLHHGRQGRPLPDAVECRGNGRRDAGPESGGAGVRRFVRDRDLPGHDGGTHVRTLSHGRRRDTRHRDTRATSLCAGENCTVGGRAGVRL